MCGKKSDYIIKFFTEIDEETGEVGYSNERISGIKPVVKGHTTNESELESIYNYVMNTLQPEFKEENYLIINVRPDITEKELQHTAEFFLETKKYVITALTDNSINGFGLGEEGLMAFYADGFAELKGAVILHSGESCSHICSIVDGHYTTRPSMIDMPTAADLTQIVHKSLLPQYENLTLEQARTIKEQKPWKEEYELPDGTILKTEN